MANENKIQAIAIEHADVRGKKLFYLRIYRGEHEVVINVGEKTYLRVKELEKVKELPLKEGGK